MKKGAEFTLEFARDGWIWEVDVYFTGKVKTKKGVTKFEFQHAYDDERKPYKLTKKAFNACLCDPSDWEMIGDDEEAEW